jgi:hypothetical protein
MLCIVWTEKEHPKDVHLIPSRPRNVLFYLEPGKGPWKVGLNQSVKKDFEGVIKGLARCGGSHL